MNGAPTDDEIALVRLLAARSGFSLSDGDVHEVAVRFISLLAELDPLMKIDLSGVEPVTVFRDTDEPRDAA
jgi:hypothetical protein